jgi:glycosyltransferase involved in cell wall biosynthesis
VLILHSRYLSGSTSGENRVVEDESRLLLEAGHDVEVWSPAPVDSSRLRHARAGLTAIYSPAAANEVRSRIRSHRPDIIHCHNLFPALSPSVIAAAAGEGVPAVLTLHNYRLICLPATLFRDGEVCEACLGRLPWRGVAFRCYRSSAGASAALGASLTLHRAMGTFGSVSLFLAISRFMRDKHVEAGLDPERIRIKPHFTWEVPRRSGPGKYFLYLGRLAPEKGVETLLEAWRDAPGRLVVVGDGPEASRLRSLAPDAVEFPGPVSAAEVPELLSHARALLVPSRWYEGAGKVVIEAYAAGVPVLASRIGALPELVHDGVSGLLLAPGEPAAWAEASSTLMSNEVSQAMGDAAWRHWHDEYRPARGLEHLEVAYAEAIAGGLS